MSLVEDHTLWVFNDPQGGSGERHDVSSRLGQPTMSLLSVPRQRVQRDYRLTVVLLTEPP